MKTYNDLYLSTRNLLRQSGIEAYALEARELVAGAAGKTTAQLLRDINLYTTSQVENTVLDYTAFGKSRQRGFKRRTSPFFLCFGTPPAR